jgi:hypothetical protein
VVRAEQHRHTHRQPGDHTTFWTSDDPTNPLRNPALRRVVRERREPISTQRLDVMQSGSLHRQSDEQHMADVAASALAILNKLEYDLRELLLA